MNGELIPLTKGLFATVDAADYEWLAQWTWHAFKNQSGNWYAARTVHISGSGKHRKKKVVYMHMDVLGAGPGEMVDHRDGNGLNNRRSNLRRCTKAQNAMNSRPQAGSSSRYKGVYRKRNGLWCANIKVSGKTLYLGSFDAEEDAARAYDLAAAERFGEFARLNFPITEAAGAYQSDG